MSMLVMSILDRKAAVAGVSMIRDPADRADVMSFHSIQSTQAPSSERPSRRDTNPGWALIQTSASLAA